MRPWHAAVLAVMAALACAAPTLAAGPTRLMQASVAPTSGTTSTSFSFSVHYLGNTTKNETASSVTAVASNGSTTRTTVLAMTAGTSLDGTWTGSNTLPAGTWSVTFNAASSLGTNPDARFTTPVVVTPIPAPTPTPAPSAPTATPRPTPRPTGVPSTPTPAPAASPTPFEPTLTDPSGSPASSTAPDGSASPSPSAGPAGSPPFTVPAEGVVAIGLLGAVTVAAALGERRRRQAVDAFRAAEAASGGAVHDGGLEPGWEDNAVQDETVATIDYEGLDDPDPDELD